MSDGWEQATTVAGRPAGARDRQTSYDMAEIRVSASKWQAAQLGIIGLISIVGLLKGGEDIRKLPTPAAVTIGLLLGLAFFSALLAIYLVSFVAYRLPRFKPRRSIDPDIGAWRTVSGAASRLRAGVLLTFLAAALVATAVALTWYVPDTTAGPTVQVGTGEGAYCGTLLAVDGGSTVVQVGPVRKTAPPTAHVSPVASCP